MELKDLQAQLQNSFDELKKAGETRDNEVKRFGEETAETKKQITAISSAMDEIKKQIDDMATKANRAGFGGGNGDNMTPEQKAVSDAFYGFVREGKSGLTREQKALVEDSTGEIIVPEALDTELYRQIGKLTVMRQLVTAKPTNSNRVRRRSMNEVTIGWGKLETSATKKLSDFESDLTPAEDWIYIEDALGLTKIGEDELEDTDINLQAYIADSFAQAYAESEDYMFLKGQGHGMEQPEGILLGTKVKRKNTAAANTYTADDLIKLEYEVKAQFRRNGSYIVNSAIELGMRLLKNADGQYLWQPSLQAGTPAQFNGKAVHVQDDLDNEATTGKELAVFGDYKAGYRIYDRKGGTLTRINELYIEDGLIGFKYKRRTGGGIVRPEAMAILKVQ
jgi:HK97 family phage major capsid protein